MLGRVGALYHDIGKMNNPTILLKINQQAIILMMNIPNESAKIINDHVMNGLRLRKNIITRPRYRFY